MKYLTNQIRKDIIEHSLNEAPNECCGMIYENKSGYQSQKCKNTSADKEMDFRISAIDYLNISERGDIKAYYHSHVHDKSCTFSDRDKKVSVAHGIPLIMYCMEKQEFLEYI